MADRINSLSDLFEHELKDIYDAEKKLVDALGVLARESTDPKVRDAFTSHQAETRGHIERIEQVFALLGKEATRGEGCAGIDGLLEEKKSFGRKSAPPAILQVFNLGAAAKTERYEITAYESLVDMAEKLGLDEAAELLASTLEEESAALDTVLGFAEEAPRPDTGASKASTVASGKDRK